MNVSLTDLNLTVKALTTVNLLDKRHYNLTEEQLRRSAEKGSIFNKNDKIFVRKVEAQIDKPHHIYMEENINLNSRERSILSIKQEKYEELDVSDESFASDMADLDKED